MKKLLLIAGATIVTGVLALGASSASAIPAQPQTRAVSAAAEMAAPPTAQQPAAESLYVPITPCRIADTRSGAGTNGTPLKSQQIRAYYVGGTAGFAPQGGKSGGCGIPVGAVSVAATLTAVDATHAGYLRAWPNGQTEPQATVLNYGTASTGTGATLSVNPSSALSLRVHNYGGPTDLVIDVSGYYVKQLAGFISPTGGTYAGSSRVVSSALVSTGIYNVTFDRNVRYCSAVASGYFYDYRASTDSYAAASGNTVRVRLFNASGAPVSGYFSITVTC